MPVVPGHEHPTRSGFRNIFFGPNGIRAGWRCLMFFVLTTVISIAIHIFRKYVLHSPSRDIHAAIEPLSAAIREALAFLIVALAALIMSRMEREKWEHYGLPLWRRRNLFFGLVWGFATLSLVMGALWMVGSYRIDGLALSGTAALRYAALWAVVFLFVGLFEEFSLRGYPLYTLASGMGFWPSALLTSALFMAGHIRNPGETWLGLTYIFVDGIFLCFMVWRTGDLWFAVGTHASWDWGLTFFYSVPNSGIAAVGNLFSVRVQGPSWLSGGNAGPEGSAINLAFEALYVVVFASIYKRRQWMGMNDHKRPPDAPPVALGSVGQDFSPDSPRDPGSPDIGLGGR